jgi:hypothetical protein
MKLLNKITAAAATLGLSTAMLISFGGVASADCFQYNANGFTTSNTPVFNNICNVPNGIGDEANFVKIRPNTTGDDTSTSNNAAYAANLNAACNNGDSFDIHTYIHNDATADQNNSGSGTAVAHGVQLSLAAATGTTASSFNFASMVTANNAATVHDSTTLNCSNGPVKLTLVPSSVKVYGTQYSWTGLPDNSVNGTFKIGSPIINSGDQWGCWNYRVVVVYEVTVQKETPPPPTPSFMCTALGLVAEDNRRVKLNIFTTTASNGAVFKDAVINWGDNSALLTTGSVVGQTHQYAADGTYLVTAIAHFTVNGQDVTSGGAQCQKQVTFSSNVPPTVTPPSTTSTTPTPAAPTALVNTGPGSVVGLFAATTAIGAVAHRWMLGRRLSRQ